MVLLPLGVLGFGLTVTALQRDKRQYGRKKAPAAVTKEGTDAVSDADSVPAVSVVEPPPSPSSYLPVGFPKSTADAFAVVDGEPLPLHSQVLAMQSSVLRDVFLTHQESGQRVGMNTWLLCAGCLARRQSTASSCSLQRLLALHDEFAPAPCDR